MNKITIVHLKDPGDTRVIRCDRRSPLGNPFVMVNEKMRDEVCDNYDVFFKERVKRGGGTDFMHALRSLYRIWLEEDIALGCWCAPKRCHCETIKAFLEEQYANK